MTQPSPMIMGAVLYAIDHARVAAFYRDVLGLSAIESDASHTRLRGTVFELVVHAQTPQERAVGGVQQVASRRTDASLRLIFAVADLPRCRAAAVKCGGQIDAEPPDWAGSDAKLRLGHDPEGNVFQVQPFT